MGTVLYYTVRCSELQNLGQAGGTMTKPLSMTTVMSDVSQRSAIIITS